jgi:hypothetical protein
MSCCLQDHECEECCLCSSPEEQENNLVTDSNTTLIAALLDRSGSMGSCKESTQDGFNELVKDQRNQPGTALMTLAQFDLGGGGNEVPEWVYRNKAIADVPDLVLEPRGSTPLLEAIGEFITAIGKDLAALPEASRPGTVICLIMTDGYENASWGQWRDRAKVKALVEQQETQWNWKFIFLGANMDAIAEGAKMGFSRGSSLTYDPDDGEAVRGSYAVASASMSAVRGGLIADVNFTDDERKRADRRGKTPSGSGSKRKR